MAKYQGLGPIFDSVDFNGWPAWPMKEVNGVQYRQIPGVDGYLFNPAMPGGKSVFIDNSAQYNKAKDEQKNATNTALIAGVGAPIGSVAAAWGVNAAANSGAAAAGTAAGTGAATGAGTGIVGGTAAGTGATVATPTVVSATPVAAGGAAGTGTAGAAGTTAVGGGLAAGAATVGGAALGAWNAYEGYKAFQEGNASKTGTHTAIGAMGTPLGPVWGYALGYGATKLQGGKNPQNKFRSKLRDGMVEAGFAQRTTDLGGTIDPSQVDNPSGTYVQLADGTYFDISKDGSNNGYDVQNPNGAYSGQAVMFAQPLAALLAGRADEKGTGWFTGYLANAIMSNANGDPEIMRANAQAIAAKMGLTPEQARAEIDKMVADKVVDAQTAAVYKQGVDQIQTGDASTYITDTLSQGEQKLFGTNLAGKADKDSSNDAPLVAPPVTPAPVQPPVVNTTQPQPAQTITPMQWGAKPLPVGLSTSPRPGLVLKTGSR